MLCTSLHTLCTMAPRKTTILAHLWSDSCLPRYVCHPAYPSLADSPSLCTTICVSACSRAHVCSLFGSQLGLITGAFLEVQPPHPNTCHPNRSFDIESNLWRHDQSAAARIRVLAPRRNPYHAYWIPAVRSEQRRSNLDQVPTTCPDSLNHV